MNDNETITIRIDGRTWKPHNEGTAEYDAIQAIAGAILADASTIKYKKETE